eukprot:5185464-Pleurochrysis_carterae.AAC.1
MQARVELFNLLARPQTSIMLQTNGFWYVPHLGVLSRNYKKIGNKFSGRRMDRLDFCKLSVCAIWQLSHFALGCPTIPYLQLHVVL